MGGEVYSYAKSLLDSDLDDAQKSGSGTLQSGEMKSFAITAAKQNALMGTLYLHY